MAVTIPLCCNLCPQEPEFSDLSHLLTHVSSKGHLSHHLKAQLRGHHDVGVRRKLDEYDRWYELYDIEQLLSQRLSAKVSKQDVKKERDSSTKLTRRSRARKSRTKTSTSSQSQQSPVKDEPVIDPRLSDPHMCPQHRLDSPFHPTQPDNSYKPKTYVPRMSDWQIDIHAKSQQTSYTPSNNSPEKDVDDQYFKSFIRSPARADYPDLPELKKSIPWSQSPQIHEQPTRLQALQPRALFHVDHKDDNQDEADLLHSPTLKGVRWPGMSLFDSASLDAQRLRNQKKDRSILAQMAHNAMSVEQMEDIYWPDGTFKKRRLITGNVESSPMSQPSPIPKRSQRARTDKPRSVLADLSTNDPRIPKKRGRKPKVKQASSRTTGKENLSEIRLAHQENVPADHCSSADLTVAAEKSLLRGNPSAQPHRRTFQVFQDLSSQSPHNNHDSLSQKQNPFGTSWPSCSTGIQSGTPYINDTTAPVDWYNEFRSYVKSPICTENSENIPPRSTSQARSEHPEGSTGRVTQRYFAVTGNEEPQFFDSMPPQMEFGGMVGPKYRGGTLNPLNPLNPYFRALQSQTPCSWAHSAHGPTIKDNNQYQCQPMSSKLEKSKVGERRDS